MSNKEIKEYDKNNNLIYFKNQNGSEFWQEYDEKGNLIYFKSSTGFEQWYKYDENNNKIYSKNSNNEEYWYKYDEDNKRVRITHQEFKQIERIKLYLNNKKISRFEIMDI